MGVRSFINFFAVIAIGIFLPDKAFSQDCGCDPTVPVYNVDFSSMSGDTAIFEIKDVGRDGDCTNLMGGTESASGCIQFVVTLNPKIDILSFNYIGAPAQDYYLDCDEKHEIRAPVCASGAGTVTITYCKPGGNVGDYTITAIQEAEASGDIALSNGCTAEISVEGLEKSSISWTTVYPGAEGDYNTYLSATSGEDTVSVTPGATPPDYIDIKVTGNQDNICTSNITEDTVRVYFVSDKSVSIDPPGAAICADGTPATLTANVTGGAPPYSYEWSTGELTQSISVASPGWYHVTVTDTTACPPFTDSVQVTEHVSPISVLAGTDVDACIGTGSISLSGTVDQALGGIWSGGLGTYAPGDTILGTDMSVGYTPTAAEETAGSLEMYLTSYGNGDCPADSDTIQINFYNAPVVNVGNDTIVCASNDSVTFSGSVTVGATTGEWTTSGTGTFSPSNTTLSDVSYIPSSADTANGFVDITLTSTNTGGCAIASASFRISFEEVPIVDAGMYAPVCSDAPVINLNGTYANATGITWSTAGTGAFGNNLDPATAYTPSVDDIAGDSVKISVTSTGTTTCSSATDSAYLIYHQLPVVTLPADDTVCASVSSYSIDGSITGITYTGTWTTSGTGSFSPTADTIDVNYAISPDDTTAGAVTLTFETTNNGACPVVSESVELTFDPVPFVDAGPNKNGCANNPDVTLEGSVINATGSYWQSNGTGSFSPDSTTLSPVYSPSLDDIVAGVVVFTLTSTGNGTCPPKTDVTSEIISLAPDVEAGNNQSVCANDATVTLSGTIANGSGKGRWSSSGDGVFSPHDSSLTASYIPGVNDTAAGTVKLYLTSIDNGLCLPEKDSLTITITSAPVVNAGPDAVVCANNNIINLNGSFSVAGGIEWSSYRGGSFSNGNTDPVNSYSPGETAGYDSIYITTTGNGTCLPAIDTLIVEVTPAPVVNAGADVAVCLNAPDVNLSGSVTAGASTGKWETSGDGSFDDANVLNTVYHLGANDTSGVQLILTSMDNGSCLPVKDTMLISVLKLPTANAGSDQTLCSNNGLTILNGSVTDADSHHWSTSGDGTFGAADTSLSLTYEPGSSDTASGSVTLTLIAQNTCQTVQDDMVLTLTPAPVVTIGPDVTVCISDGKIDLSGSVTEGASTGIWSTTGDGVFLPDSEALTGSYEFGDSDTLNGTATLRLVSTNNGNCLPVSEEMILTLLKAPAVKFQGDDTICAGENIVLKASVSGGSGDGVWTSADPNGFFLPDIYSDSVTYVPSTNDLSNNEAVLSYTTINDASCPPARESKTVIITQPPVINAGADITVCANNAEAQLNGIISGSINTGIWISSGTGHFDPDETDLNASYLPSNQDTAAGSVVVRLYASGSCESLYDSLLLTFSPAPAVDAGDTAFVCEGTSSIDISGQVSGSTTSGVWKTLGDGTFSLPTGSLDNTYNFGPTDLSTNKTWLTLESTNNGNCLPVTDSQLIQITSIPVVDVGMDQTVCTNDSLVLNGLITGGSGKGIWSTTGDGFFHPSDTLLDATYIPGTNDALNGTATLRLTTIHSCTNAFDELEVTVITAPEVFAGNDTMVCEGSLFIDLNGEVTAWAQPGEWSSSGNGNFDDDNNLSARYSFGTDDLSSGSVNLILRSTNNLSCNASLDTMLVQILNDPLVNAGTDITICANGNASLSGNITGGTGKGIWSSSGSGTFYTSDTLLTTAYVPSAADTMAGGVILTLTTVNTGLCPSATDDLILQILDAPVAMAGGVDSVCRNNPVLGLNGNVYNAGGGVWSSFYSGGSFNPDDSLLTTTYAPASDELALTEFNMLLTTIDNGICDPAYDTLVVVVLEPPIVDAGADKYICKGTTSVYLTGSISGTTNKGTWTTIGTGTFFPSADSLNTFYQLSAGDVAAGTIDLVFESRKNKQCSPVKDTLKIILTEVPIVDAGVDQTVCANRDTVQLSGTVSGGSATGKWSVIDGDGVFVPNSDDLNALYIPGSKDETKGYVDLMLVATDACVSVRDTMRIGVTPSPVVFAGEDIVVCENSTSVTLSGEISGGATVGIWSSFGTGSFTDATDLNTTYFPSDADTSAGAVCLLLKTTDHGLCYPVTDTVLLSFGNRPEAQFTSPDTVCSGEIISFTNQSTITDGFITSYTWYFDTDTSSGENPDYTFITKGDHEVLLIAGSDIGCVDTMRKKVHVPSQPIADFSYQNNCQHYQVKFNNLSTAADTFHWYFGNGNESILQDPPLQVYTDDGTYDGKLIVTDEFGCTDTASKPVTIKPTPVAAFGADLFCEGIEANFTDKSTVENDTIQKWHWDFGDGATDTVQHPSHVFNSSDSTFITLIASTGSCADTAEMAVAPLPKPAFNPLPAEGCTPLRINYNLDTIEGASYTWDFGDGFSSRQKLPTHTFFNNSDTTQSFNVKLVVQTPAGCVDSATSEIKVFPVPAVEFTYAPDGICSRDTIFFANNTEKASSFTWDFGDGCPREFSKDVQHVFSNDLYSDTYYPVKLKATNNFGCSDSAINYVTVYPIPDISIQSEDTACHFDLVEFTSAPGGEFYEWYFSDGTSVTGSNSVNHIFRNESTEDSLFHVSLIYTSTKSCVDTAIKDIVVSPAPSAEFDIGESIGCAPYYSPEFHNTSTGASDFYWDFGDGISDSLINDDHFNHSFENTTDMQLTKIVSMEAVSANGCVASETKTVNIYPEIDAAFTADSSGCSPLIAAFENQTQDIAFSRWIFGDGNQSTNKNPTHTYVNNTDLPASFESYLIATSVYGCKDTSEHLMIQVKPSPGALFTLDNSAGCSPFNIEVSNETSGADEYFWSYGDGNSNNSTVSQFNYLYENKQPQVLNFDIKLVGVNVYGCTDTVTETVNVYPEVLSDFSVDTIGCTPHKVQFVNNSHGAKFYNWVLGDGNTSTGEAPRHNYTNLTQQPRTYTAKLITLSEYLCSDTSSQDITVFQKPDATFTVSDNAGCAPYEIFLTDSTSGVTGFYWDFGNGETITTENFVSSHVYDHEQDVPQIYDVLLEVENEHLCTDTVSHTITIYPKVEAAFEARETGCSPLTVNFENLSDKVMTYDWNFGDGGVSGLVHPQHTFINEGTVDTSFNIKLVAESHFHCSDTATKEILVYATPDPEFLVEPSYQVLPSSSVSVENLTEGEWDFHWDFADGHEMIDKQPVRYSYDTWGEYKIVLTVKSQTNGTCVDTISHSISIVPGSPVADYDSSYAGCAPLTVSFQNKSVSAGWYEWQFGDGGKSDDEHPTYTYYKPGTYVVRLKAFSPTGSDESEKHTVTVYENPRPFFHVAPKVTVIPDGTHFYNLSDNATTFKWDFGDGEVSDEPDPVHHYDEEGVYTVSLMSWTEHGCFDSIVKIDEVIIEPGCKLIFPNAFTPSDQRSGGMYDPEVPEITNDIFHPLFNNITDYHLEIYNRWGELLYISNQIDVGWDGFYNGKPAKQDVYIWKAWGRCINGKLIEKQGSVTLLR